MSSSSSPLRKSLHEEASTMEPTSIETLTIEERIQLYLEEKAVQELPPEYQQQAATA